MFFMEYVNSPIQFSVLKSLFFGFKFCNLAKNMLIEDKMKPKMNRNDLKHQPRKDMSE